jgi:hypothetical protein
MRHFSIERDYSLREISAARLSIVFMNRDALFDEPLGERPRRSPGLGELRVQPFGAPHVDLVEPLSPSSERAGA